MNNNKSSSTRRSEQTTHPKQMEEYLWKCHSDSQSPLYHSFTREHYVAIKDYLIRYREDGRSIPDMFPCIDGDSDSWLHLSEIPEHIRTKPYCGKLMERGKYPPINADIMSSYQCFEKTPEQLEEERVQKRQSNLQAILQALGPTRGANGGGAVSSRPQTESFVIRFILSEDYSHGDLERKADVLVQSNDERTLQDLYDLKEIKDRVRSGFCRSVAREVRSERKEIILVYRNYNDTKKSYQQFSMDSLSQYKVKDIISSIPTDNNGLVDGACFPITIYVEAVDTGGVLDMGEFI